MNINNESQNIIGIVCFAMQSFEMWISTFRLLLETPSVPLKASSIAIERLDDSIASNGYLTSLSSNLSRQWWLIQVIRFSGTKPWKSFYIGRVPCDGTCVLDRNQKNPNSTPMRYLSSKSTQNKNRSRVIVSNTSLCSSLSRLFSSGMFQLSPFLPLP